MTEEDIPQREPDEFELAMERMHIANDARGRLGLPVKNVISTVDLKLSEPLPRFARMVIAVRAAIRGWNDPSVQHMVERNKQLDLWRAVEGMA